MEPQNTTETSPFFGQKELFDYYWKYYELQSNQRNQLCTFYFTIMSALIAVFTALYPDSKDYIWIICAAMSLIALFFGLMYHRTTTLRNHARKCLIEFEEEFFRGNSNTPMGKMEKIFDNEKKKINFHTICMYIQFAAVFGLSLFFAFSIHYGWI